MGVQVGPKSMAYAETYNDHRIMREKESLTLKNWPGYLAEQKNYLKTVSLKKLKVYSMHQA